MPAFIAPPARIPFYLRIGLAIARRKAGTDLLLARLLTWYPRAAVGSGVLEALVAHSDGRIDERMLKLVRLAVSFEVECQFCIGLNSQGWEEFMTAAELDALQKLELDRFAPREQLAIEYSRLASATPLAFAPEFGERLRETFTEREIVVLATTAAQVNYWARLAQSLGDPVNAPSTA